MREDRVRRKSKQVHKAYDNYAIPMENRFDKALVEFFNKQAKRLKNRYIRQSTKQDISKDEATRLANNEVNNKFDWEMEERRLLQVMFPLWKQSGVLGNELSNLVIGLTGDDAVLYSIIDESYLKWLSTYGGDQIKRITQSTKDTVKLRIRDGLLDGLSEKEIADNISKSVKDIGFNRAKTIARTETHNTFMKTRELNAEKGGFEYWMWLTAEDEAVRGMKPTDQYSHVINNGVVVKMGDLFPSGITRPGDPNGAAGNVINCRCEIIPVSEEEYLEYLRVA